MTALHTLVLQHGAQDPGAYGVLERLPCLRRLHLNEQFHVPACLPRLTGLEELLLASIWKGTGGDKLDPALRSLTELTSL